MMSESRFLGKHHQRSSSTGSHGLLFGIGPAGGIYHQPLTHQASSQSTDPLTDEEEEEESESVLGTSPDLKGMRVVFFKSELQKDLFTKYFRHIVKVDELHPWLARSLHCCQRGNSGVLQVSVGNRFWLSRCYKH